MFYFFETMSFVNIILNILVFLLIAVVLRKQIYFLYIWQWKEYRVDKFLDLVKSGKFSRVFLDFFTICRLLGLFILFLGAIFHPIFSYFDYLFIILICVLELGYFAKQIFARKVLVPKYTYKLFSLGVISVLLNLILLIGLVSFIAKFYKYDFQILIIFLILTIAQPLITFASILIITPFDIYLKCLLLKKAREYRLSLDKLKVVGISGSYGKSSTKEILYSLLEREMKVEKTFKNHNSTLAVARKILSLDNSVDMFISEIGAYREGDGIDQCKFSLPNISIITGLNNQHFALFGGKNEIIRAESESLQFLKKGNFAIINWDSLWCREIKIPVGIKLIKYGFSEGTDFKASIVNMDLAGTSFNIIWNNNTYFFKTNLTSQGSIQNILAGIATSVCLGLNIEDLSKKVEKLNLPDATLNISKKEFGFIIDDTYNANLDGVLNALNLLNLYKGKKVLFLDDLAELGDEAKITHEQIANKIVEVNLDLVVLTGSNFLDVVQTHLRINRFPEEKVLVSSSDSASIYELLTKLKSQKVAILYEGYLSRNFL